MTDEHDIVQRLQSRKLPSCSPDGGQTSQIDFMQILADRREAAAIIEAQQALIDRLQYGHEIRRYHA